MCSPFPVRPLASQLTKGALWSGPLGSQKACVYSHVPSRVWDRPPGSQGAKAARAGAGAETAPARLHELPASLGAGGGEEGMMTEHPSAPRDYLEVGVGVGVRQPGGARVLLVLEGPVEGLRDGTQVEDTHGGGGDAVPGGPGEKEGGSEPAATAVPPLTARPPGQPWDRGLRG